MKKLKQKNKLTFANDEELADETNERMVSSHDMLKDNNLSKEVALTQEEITKKKQEKEEEEAKKK